MVQTGYPEFSDVGVGVGVGGVAGVWIIFPYRRSTSGLRAVGTEGGRGSDKVTGRQW